jgi:hypothetical protein
MGEQNGERRAKKVYPETIKRHRVLRLQGGGVGGDAIPSFSSSCGRYFIWALKTNKKHAN